MSICRTDTIETEERSIKGRVKRSMESCVCLCFVIMLVWSVLCSSGREVV
jgi:hypothetical protein